MLFKWIKHRLQGGGGQDRSIAQARALRGRGEFDAARGLCLEVLREEPDHSGALALLIGLAADQRQIDAGLQWARRALAADPHSVAAHYALGQVWEVAERHADAEACYRRVTELDPAHAKAHNNLGCMLHMQGRLAEALACYSKALALEPGQPEALRNYVLIAGGVKELAVAMEGFQARIAAHPKDAWAHCQLAHIHTRLGRHEQALAGYEQALALEPDEADFHFARAQLLLNLGRYAEGWREYEWRWRIGRFNAPMHRFSQPRWDGSRMAQGTLLIHGETGFGDMFQFVRYATLAAERCARVVVECQPALKGLVADVVGVSQVVSQGEALPAFDAHIPLIALPAAFGTTIDTIPWAGPYVAADPRRVQAWAERVQAVGARGRKVGLVWTGNPQNLGNRERSVSLQSLAPLAQAEDVTFFSLQKGADTAQAGQVPQGMHFVDLTPDIGDFSDTAALMTQLDLVISVDTAVAHLAGAMGRPTWVLLPYSADWRYHDARRDNPWYPTMQLFRQASEGDWDSVLPPLARALADWAAAPA